MSKTATIFVNRMTFTIEITKSFEQKARKFGSAEYNLLRDAKLDNPNFRIVVKKPKTKPSKYRGLDNNYIKAYVEKHGSDDQKKVINNLITNKTNFAEIRSWFFTSFPEVRDFKNHLDMVLAA